MKARAMLAATIAALGLGAAHAATLPAWTDGQHYAVGDVVQYQGNRYQATIAHTAWTGAGWNPVAAVSLWRTIGACVGADGGDQCNPPKLTSAAWTTWSGGARGAYSLVHDDFCSLNAAQDGQLLYAEPELNKRGLRAGFAVITGACDTTHWDAARRLRAKGHELISHSRNHYNANTPAWNSDTELQGSSDDIAAHLDGYRPTFFAWPSDIAPDAPVAALRANAGYLGGRAYNRVDENGNIQYGMAGGLNAANFADAYAAKWDLFTQSGQWSLYEGQPGENLNLHVDAAINQGGWALRTTHGVADGSYETVPLPRYLAHLDYVKAKVDAGELWMAPPSEVVRYRFAREACAPTLVGEDTVRFADNATCRRYATTLTLDFATDRAATTLAASQAGHALTVKTLAPGRYRVEADPLAGDVAIAAR
ncbi:carbohydrate-binding protein [Chitiniphilus shinanonensis]|uniref:carbohydrate-binding protein n=1 Tax=Chitiniphilus shinanonensis TaxID=553088 RepID=UPI0033426794